jgi:hypothetical protein
MNTYAIRSALVSTLGVALALASGSALATTYRLTDLGTLGGSFSEGAAINDSGVNIQPDAGEPVNEIVSARGNLTGENFQFSAPRAAASALRPGASIALDSSGAYAVVQSGVTAGGDKDTYSFPLKAAQPGTAADVGASEGDVSAEDSQYWEIKPNDALKGPTGRIVVEYPGTGSLIFHVLGADNRQLAAWYKQGSGNFMPGSYTVKIWNGALQGVPVKKNMDTRMKVGVLKLNIQEPYKLLDASGKTMFSGHPKEKPLIVFPVGDYTIKTKTLEEPIAIKDGQVTEF